MKKTFLVILTQIFYNNIKKNYKNKKKMIFVSLLFNFVISLESWDPNAITMEYITTQGSSLTANTQSNCPCETNNYTCIPNCCCSARCSTFYSATDANCYPVPSTALVQMCNSFSKDEVGSVSNWLMRTIFCVYRENNPLTSRGETFAVPDSNYDATPDQLSNTISSNIDAQTTTTTTTSDYVFNQTEATVAGATKPTNRGYLFGQSLMADATTPWTVTATGSDGTTAYNVEFGVNQEFAYVTTLASAAPTLSAQVLIAPYNAGVIQTTSPTIDTTLTTTKFVGVAISILYRSFGYKQAPQNVIDGFDVKVTYSDYPEENHYGFVTTDGDVYVKTTINFYELPSDENLLKTSNSADVNSWLPFNWRGVNY